MQQERGAADATVACSVRASWQHQGHDTTLLWIRLHLRVWSARRTGSKLRALPAVPQVVQHVSSLCHSAQTEISADTLAPPDCGFQSNYVLDTGWLGPQPRW